MLESFCLSITQRSCTCLSVRIALFLPPQPVLVQNGGVWLGHNGVTRKLLTRATAGDTLLQNAVAGVASPLRNVRPHSLYNRLLCR